VTYFFETYGCQMNTAESAALELACRERGWNPASGAECTDLILINTCSVRITAETRALGRIAHYAALKRKRQAAGGTFALVLAGCMAQRMGQEIQKRYPAVDYVMGTAARSMFPRILEAVEECFLPFMERQGDDSAGKTPSRTAGFSAQAAADRPFSLPPVPELSEQAAFSFSSSHLEEGQFRSFIPIMHGCDNFCAYCIVPHVRGREISRDPRLIIDEIGLVGGRGVREITLLGQNVNTYRWQDDKNGGKPLDFAGLLRLVAQEAAKSGVQWVRFLSANPKNFSAETIQVMAENPVFCRHIHLCVQHGSNRILSGMNRGYTREQYLSLVRDLRAALPNFSLSTDILVGFPGETDDDLAQTLDLMEEVRFSYAYMYHYNPREGTAAFNLPGRIPDTLKRERLAQVISLQKKHTVLLLKSKIGRRERVLVEGISRKNADELISRTERDETVAAPGSAALIGSFAELTLSELRGTTFRAKELLSCSGV
jgi:tRNA-2-methylthio-N6-dimethylallyladenosine synthase